MSGLVYYIPGRTSIERPDLAALGLDAVWGVGLAQCQCSRGPDGAGAGGVCIGYAPDDPAGAPPRVGYYPEDQEWSAAAGGAYWIGFEKAARPRPQDLARQSQLMGHEVELADGARWLVPVARRYTGGSPLPQTIRLAADGSAVMEIAPAFRAFSAEVEKLFPAFIHGNFPALAGPEPAGGRPVYTWADRLRWCATALGLNYRIGPWELSALGLLTTEAAKAIERAIIDWPSVEAEIDALSKKNSASRSDGSITGSGAPGS